MEAVIFDMDGVLIDSVALQVRAFTGFFERYRVAFGMADLGRFNGRSTPDILQTVRDERALDYDLAQAAAEVGRIARELLEDAKPFAGAQATVRALRMRGYRVAVASSAPSAIVRQLCGDWPWDAIVSGDDVHRSKPEPDIFLAAAHRLGVPPAECAVVEDSPLGIRAAAAAGMLTIGVTTAADESELDAAICIGEIRQLLTLPQLFAKNILLMPAQPLTLDQIELTVDRVHSELPEALADSLACVPESDRPLHNGKIANLRSYSLVPGRLALDAGITDFATYNHLAKRSDYDIFAHGICAMGTSALLITHDGHAILATRGAGLGGEGMVCNIPGGLLNVDRSASLEYSIFGELHEELGLSRCDVSSCAFIGIGHDLVSKGAELMFSIGVNRGAQEVIAAQREAQDAFEAHALRAVPLAALRDYLELDAVMPATRALIQCYLNLQQGTLQ